MSFIYLAFTLVLLVVNLIGVALWLRPYLPNYLLAKVAGVIGLCLAGLFIEHFIGLGRLAWVWPVSTGLSLFALYRSRDLFRQQLWRQELVFVLALLVYVGWRYCFPDLDPHSEQLTDLSMIVSYLPGQTLPPPDAWQPLLHLNMYYAFQHYAAALMGRIFVLSPGLTMNLAIAVIYAMLVSLCWVIVSRYTRKAWLRGLMLFAVMAGGTGIAPLTHLIYDQNKPGHDLAFTLQQDIWANTRFTGTYDQKVDTRLGKSLFHPAAQNGETRDLPLETLGYLTLLGDYHPPLGGLLLLFVALACLSLLETSDDVRLQRVCTGLFAASVPLTLITNAWVFPLQALLLLGWMVHRRFQVTGTHWRALWLGLGIALLGIYPYLSQLASHALHPQINWVSAIDHTPWDRFLAVHWPELVLLGLAAIAARHTPQRRWQVLVLALLLLCSELFYVDDPMGGKYNRFNSTLKWWSWIYPAVILMLGSWLLSAGRIYRWSTIAVLLLISTAGLDLLAFGYNADKPSLGRLDGHAWLTRDPTNANILRWLKVMPRGTVLEGIGQRGNYIPTSAFALFAGKPSAIGWPDDETEWRQDGGAINRFAENTRRFYRGLLPDSVGWLDANRVDYIIWSESDQNRTADAWSLINGQIAGKFYWVPIQQQDNQQLGIWYRKSIRFPL